MSQVTIRTRNDGPLVVDGAVKITDADGNEFPVNSDKPAVALCRCGGSGNKPFCDGSHRQLGFKASEQAPRASP